MQTSRSHIGLAIAVSIPFAVLLIMSFGQSWSFPAILPETFTGAAWRNALTGAGDLIGSLAKSLSLALLVASLATGLAFVCTRSLSRSRVDWLPGLAYMPYVFSPVVLAACLQFYFLRSGLSGTLAGVALGQFFLAFPFACILLYPFWTPHLHDMEQCAATLGAGQKQVFRQILWPLARGPLSVVFFQSFLISWFEYGLTLLIGVGKVDTLPIRVFQFVREANPFYAAMASLLIAIPPVVLLFINRRVIFLGPAASEASHSSNSGLND
jgi:putative spermidine/putrescine transport system permease protein